MRPTAVLEIVRCSQQFEPHDHSLVALTRYGAIMMYLLLLAVYSSFFCIYLGEVA